MSKKIMLRQGSSSHRRQPLLQKSNSSRRARTRLGEAVGGTAAVCCCCPAVVANVMFLAIYKVPATLCRRVIEKNKKLRQKHRRNFTPKEGLLPTKRACTCGCCDDVSIPVHPTCGGDDVADESCNMVRQEEEEEDKDVVELEKEMWEKFNNTGFWRSPSQRDSTCSSQWITSPVSVPNLEVLAASN